MKKINTFIAILFLIIVSGQDIKYGITGNFHRGSTVGIHDRSKGAYGGGIGVFADFHLVENDIYDSAWLYFTPQLEFSMEGERAEGNYWSTVGKDVQKYHNYYIAIPLYIKYFIRNHGYKTNFYVMLGPKFEFLVYEKADEDQAISDILNAGYLPNNPNYTGNYKKTIGYWGFDNAVAKFGYGVSAAVGMKVDEKWDIFLRFDRGFSKVYPDYTKHNTYNRLLAIGVNYYLGEK